MNEKGIEIGRLGEDAGGDDFLAYLMMKRSKTKVRMSNEKDVLKLSGLAVLHSALSVVITMVDMDLKELHGRKEGKDA